MQALRGAASGLGLNLISPPTLASALGGPSQGMVLQARDVSLDQQVFAHVYERRCTIEQTLAYMAPSMPGLTAALALVSASAHATNGYFSHGYGIQSKGAAGVGAALPQDSLASATNPAGLVSLGNRLDLGLDYFVPDRGASIHDNAFGPDQSFDGNGTHAFYIPEFGYVRQLDDRVAIGLALYGNGGMNTDYTQNPYARFGATGRAGVDFAQAFLTPSVAWRLNDRHSLGLALNLAYQRFEARGIAPFAGFSSDPAHVSDNGRDSSTATSVRVGWQGEISKTVTLGASWQSRGEAGNFDKYRGLFADHGGFDIPETWVLGSAWKTTEALTLAADVQRINYSDIHSVGNSVQKLYAGQPLGSNDGLRFRRLGSGEFGEKGDETA